MLVKLDFGTLATTPSEPSHYVSVVAICDRKFVNLQTNYCLIRPHSILNSIKMMAIVYVYLVGKKYETVKSLIAQTDNLFALFRVLLGLGLFNVPLAVDHLEARLAYPHTRAIFTQNVIQRTDDLKKGMNGLPTQRR